MNRGGRLLPLFLLTLLVPLEASRAQIAPPKPAPMAVSVGLTWALPLADLALQSPGTANPEDPGDGRYATAGTALTQRIAYAPFGRIGLFLQATFPVFGVDVDAAQSDFQSSPPLVKGKNEIVAWIFGVRWRGGRSWQQGPYVELMTGRYRVRTELKLQGLDPEGVTHTREPGWGAAGGWLLRVGPAFALDIGITLHEFREDYFMNRWIGLRTLAVMTFGGER